MYYALTDSSTGDNPREYTSGFANKKEVLAFRSRFARDEWVASTRLLTAMAISRREAIRLTPWKDGWYYGRDHWQVKPVRVYGEMEPGTGNPVHHILAAK